jgi:capsular exopolysaccharide synthesis family protein
MSTAPTRPPSASAPPRPATPAGPASKLNVAIDPMKLLRQNWLWLGLAGFLGVVLGVGAYFALLTLAPLFTARAYFEVVGQIESADEQISSIGRSEDEIERYIQTQVARMISDDVLRDAAADPQIQRETQWSQQFLSASGQYDPVEAYLAIKDIVTVRAVPETNFITMEVVAGRKSDAETIGRVIASEYLESMTQEQSQGQLDVQQSLTNQLNAIQEERLLIEDRMRRLLRDNNLTTLDERLTGERMVLEQTMPLVQSIRYELGNLRERLAIYEEELRAPGGANYPEDVRGAVQQHPIIAGFTQQLADLNASLRGARENFGPNHRSVRQLERTIASVEAEMAAQEQMLLDQQLTQMVEMIRNQIRAYETTEAESVAEIEEAQTRQSEIQAILEDYDALAADLERLATRETELESRISEARALQARRDSRRVRMVQTPTSDELPTFPKIIIVVPALTLLTVGFVGGLIFLRELLEQRVRGPADLALIPRLRIAGVIPDLSEDPSKPPAIETAVLDRPEGVITEAVRNIRIEVLKRFARSGHRTLVVIGGMPQSGATSFAVNFARSCASCELRTLLVDGNLRRPSVHDAMGVADGPGLSDVLANRVRLEDAVQPSNDRLDVLAAGGREHRQPERLITRSFEALLDQARSNYDLVVIDAPPAIVSSDALSIAAKCDASLLVVRAYAETRGLVTRLRGKLDESHAEFMGVVVNGVRSAAGGYFRKNFMETHRYLENGASAPGAEKMKRRGKGKTRSAADETAE